MNSVSVLPHIESGQTQKAPSRRDVLKSRTYAFIIDIYAIVFLTKAVSMTWGYFITEHVSRLNIANYSAWRDLNVNTFTLTLPVFFISYFFFFYYLNNGKSLGKMFMKLRVCAKHDHNRELSFKEAFGRSLGYLFINYLSYLPFLINYLRKDSRGIQDYISDTIVLREDEIAIIESNEEHTHISVRDDKPFPEDPVSIRISKAS